MKYVAHLSFVLITMLWGSYYAVVKEALGHTDPVVFTFFEMLVLVPIALVLVFFYRRAINTSVLKRGVVLGSCLCLALLTIAVAEKYTGATNTAFFPSMQGIFAALIASTVYKRRIAVPVWFAGGVSFSGALLILLASGGGIEGRGDLIAFLGALFFTAYTFLVDFDRKGNESGQDDHQFWGVLGIEHLTVAFWMALIALLFGDWQHFHPVLPQDITIIVYVGTATTFLPVVLSMFMQMYIDPLEVAFISILEPLWGVLFAYLYLGETMSPIVYAGGVLVVAGAIVHMWSDAHSTIWMRCGRSIILSQVRRLRIIARPLLFFAGGVIVLDWLGGFPPSSWYEMYRIWPAVRSMMDQGQGLVIVVVCLRAICWFTAWISLIAAGILSTLACADRIRASQTHVSEAGIEIPPH